MDISHLDEGTNVRIHIVDSFAGFSGCKHFHTPDLGAHHGR